MTMEELKLLCMETSNRLYELLQFGKIVVSDMSNTSEGIDCSNIIYEGVDSFSAALSIAKQIEYEVDRRSGGSVRFKTPQKIGDKHYICTYKGLVVVAYENNGKYMVITSIDVLS